MWFKQVQLFQLGQNFSYSAEEFIKKIEPFIFTPCLPSMPESIGWKSLTAEKDAPLCRSINGYTIFCMQVEEKILPSTVIYQELNELTLQLETSQNRKLKQKEKYQLKDEIIMRLLPQAFTKFTHVYAYIDTHHHWLILGTINQKLSEKFISLFKKSITDDIHFIEIKNLPITMSHWLKTKNYPSSFSIEKTCILQDQRDVNRKIRCQQQDLFATPIQSLIKDGCEVIQLGMCWNDHIYFTLCHDSSIKSIQYQDEILSQSKDLEPETKQQQFDADFLIMSSILSTLCKAILDLTAPAHPSVNINENSTLHLAKEATS